MQEATFHSPLEEFAETTVETEVRVDPLTGRTARVVTDNFLLPDDPVLDDYLPPDAVRRGLEFAAVNAATKAATGGIAGPDALETDLEYEPSMRGQEAVESLADTVDATADGGTLTTPDVVACPNRLVPNPEGTVGIGDIVSASSFALEVALTDRDGSN